MDQVYVSPFFALVAEDAVSGNGSEHAPAFVVPSLLTPLFSSHLVCHQQTNQAPGHDSDVYLRPVTIFKDPYRGGDNILVL